MNVLDGLNLEAFITYAYCYFPILFILIFISMHYFVSSSSWFLPFFPSSSQPLL